MLPHYQEINDFLASISKEYRSENPLFYCLRLKANDAQNIDVYKPPYRKNFYFISFISNAGNTQIGFDEANISHLNSFLVLQSPNLIYSFHRDNSAFGYIIYFKKECFSFFKPDFDKEFPFFNVLRTNFFRLNQTKFEEISPYFEEVFKAYETSKEHTIATLQFLTLLYRIKTFTEQFEQWKEGFTSPQYLLFQRFTQLVNAYYIDKRTVEEYADLLSVTPNHLSQTIKKVSGKNALSFINERIATEAKSLIRFTDFSIAEIAYQLGFSDTANFGKFFKKHEGKTPLQFKKYY